jgi:hypothetical protein
MVVAMARLWTRPVIIPSKEMEKKELRAMDKAGFNTGQKVIKFRDRMVRLSNPRHDISQSVWFQKGSTKEVT